MSSALKRAGLHPPLQHSALGAVAVVVLAGLSACQENINTPGQCPDLCPGEQIVVRDTVITPVAGSDSSFFGYVSKAARNALLVSSGLGAGEARGFVVFPKQRTDTIQVDGAPQAFTVDTVSISFTLQARDSTATGLQIYLHRIPITVDTTLGFDAVNTLLTSGGIIDSISVPDTVRTGRVEALLVGDELAKVATPPDDSGRIGIGLTVRASGPTGVRLSLDAIAATTPQFENRGSVNVVDTTKRRQRTSVRPDDVGKTGYVINRDLSVNPNLNLLYLGGPRAARTLLRFDLPAQITDSAQVLRATLELTPAATLLGLPNNPFGDSVTVRGIVADLGAKSPPLLTPGLSAFGGLDEGTTALLTIDMFRIVSQWRDSSAVPQAALIAMNEEAVGFMQPTFFSSRSPTGQPRLRLTYGIPTRPGRP